MLERRIPDLELNAIRSSTPFVYLGIWTTLTRNWPVVPRNDLYYVALYASLISANTLCTYTAITFVPFASAQCIAITCQVLFGLILFAVCLKENVSITTVVAIILVVTGVFLVIQPEVIFQRKPDPMNLNYSLANGDKSPSYKICQMHTQSSQLACPT